MPTRSLVDRLWFLIPLSIFAVSRVVATVLLHVGSERQVALTRSSEAYKVTVPTAESPGYLGVVSNWDGQWFRSIAENGYPTSLPRVDGEIVQNEWAFSGGYPLTVRAVMSICRIEFPSAATMVSMTCAALAVVLIFSIIRERMDASAAATLVALLSFFPSSPILQVGYSEGMALLLVVLALRALDRRTYGRFLIWAALLAVTRPLMLPLALVSGTVWILRWLGRDDTPFPQRERWIAAAATGACACLAGAWPAIVAVGTGNPTGFTDTIASWPGNQATGGLLVNWVTLAFAYPVPIGAFVLMIAIIVGWTVTRRPTRVLPTSLLLWAPMYLAYMLLATRPNAGFVRYLLLAILPLWPLLEPRALDEAKMQRILRLGIPIAFACAGVVGQYFWITRVFTIDTAPQLQPYP